MTGLNSGNISKSPISWWKSGLIGGWWDKYPPNPIGNRPVVERGKGTMPIKGGEVQQDGRFRKIEEESLENNKREKVVIEQYV